MTRRSKADTILVIVFIAFFTGMLAGIGLVEFFKPDCPTEDSCVVDYHDGEWKIKEVRP